MISHACHDNSHYNWFVNPEKQSRRVKVAQTLGISLRWLCTLCSFKISTPHVRDSHLRIVCNTKTAQAAKYSLLKPMPTPVNNNEVQSTKRHSTSWRLFGANVILDCLTSPGPARQSDVFSRPEPPGV